MHELQHPDRRLPAGPDSHDGAGRRPTDAVWPVPRAAECRESTAEGQRRFVEHHQVPGEHGQVLISDVTTQVG